MKNKALKTLLFIILTSFAIQSKSQEIKTKEDAVKILNYYAKDTFIVQHKMADGQIGWIYTKAFVIKNEYLVFKAEELNIENGKVVSNPSQINYIIDLNDSIKLIKVPKNNGIHFIIYKNKNLMFRKLMPHYISSSKRKKDEELSNTKTEKFYEAFYVLKSNLEPKEKEEYKLAELKKGMLTNSKQEISEEQRKYIVQANAANEKKDSWNAVMLFQKVIDINPYAYPAAYYNMALIYGNSDDYYHAVYSMKQYLITAPDAEDARKAQDKIYEWELNIIQ